jgi:DNA-binding IscR family transcriptional regulator
LKHLLDQALKAYFKELDGATLADITNPRGRTVPPSHGKLGSRQGSITLKVQA